MTTTPVQGEAVDRVVEALRATPLFRGLKDEQLRGVASQTRLFGFEPGEEWLSQGQVPETFILVLEGEMKVFLNAGKGPERLEVGRLAAGEIVGVTGLLLGEPSAATIAAGAKTTAIAFDPRFFQYMTERIPSFGLELARLLAQRLSQAVTRIPVPEAAPKAAPTRDLLDLMPVEFMERHRLLPLAIEGTTLTVGFVEDPTPEVVQRIRTYAQSLELRAVRIRPERLAEALRDRAGGRVATKEAPGPLPLDDLLRAMVTEGASDLHLSGGQHPRWRVDGEMRQIENLPVVGSAAILDLLGTAFPDRNREEFATTNDTDFAYSIAGLARFRVNVYRDNGGVGAVLRQIPMKVLALEQLRMPPVVAQLCTLPKGLVLVTGPTGSGKSTTLAAMVDLINRTRHEHIVTLEDPIEFVHPSQLSLVNQREVGSHTTSFSRALRAALREDPDVVLVGEMRDLETVALALETANTGHLVLGTLHTSTAASTIDRIVGMFPPEEQGRVRATVADVLKAVVAQNLLRRKGGGRVAALEILVGNAAVSNLIREGKTNQLVSAMQTGKATGNMLLNESLATLVKDGTVEYEEALAKAVDRPDLARRLNRTLTEN